MASIKSDYFIDFEFQRQGVRVNGSLYPLVKMTWSSGVTLGEFVESNVRNSSSLAALVASLRQLSAFLESQGLAHGDIQPGNVMVSGNGRALQLIDYDGMYIGALKGLGSSELGQRNFQHPSRAHSDWDATLDRFSFISLDLTLRALSQSPQLWASTRSDADGFLFRANDFADPDASEIFQTEVSSFC